jgi:hypothetical protein
MTACDSTIFGSYGNNSFFMAISCKVNYGGGG